MVWVDALEPFTAELGEDRDPWVGYKSSTALTAADSKYSHTRLGKSKVG